MLFNSLHFLIYFPIVVALYYLVPLRYRWLLLLLASCYFYMAFIPVYILILFFTITVDYFAGIFIEKSVGVRRRGYLVASIAANVGVLALFKYFNFLNANLDALASFIGWNYSIESLHLILPIGLSFHTFQSLSYTIEVYYGRHQAERHPGILAVYVLFFPQLVAGPIERPQNLLHQFTEEHPFDYARVTDGLKLILWGLFKKMVIADRLALYVNPVYNQVNDFSGWPVLLATYSFAIQIYCDFSAYSEIAVGAAQVMGFKLMTNFNRPYFAKSIAEFWRRWHISLSTWFRDYLYIPLGGNRVGKWRWYANLFIVFLVSGLWHGANWTFVIWGALHGAYFIFSIWTKAFRDRLSALFGLHRVPWVQKGVQIFITFHLVLFTWIFFRANSLADAFALVGKMWTHARLPTELPNGFNSREMIIALAAVLFMVGAEIMQSRRPIRPWFGRFPLWFRWAVYLGLSLCIMNLGVTQRIPFIYFQF